MKTRNSGFTLAEVLVAIVIGVISIAAAFASYNYFNKSYKSVSQKLQLIVLQEMLYSYCKRFKKCRLYRYKFYKRCSVLK
jgi:prepilin-type N-terminal cleavage/methylation domain-containing protein